MIFRVAIALLPMLAWAQSVPAELTPGAPPEVDRALRARVSQFFQYHVDGEFRKAYDMVAENTKEEYFNSGKMRLRKFELNDIKYGDNFTQAMVTTTVEMNWNIQLKENVSIVPMVTTWKIEDGKWVWFHEVKTGIALTPMGPSTITPGLNDKNSKAGIPEHIDTAAVTSAAQGIISQVGKQVSLDKLSVSLASGKDTLVVHNGTPGYIKLLWSTLPDIPGFSAEFGKLTLGPNEDSRVQFTYVPKDSEPRKPFQIRVLTEPANQVLAVTVDLGASPAN